MKDKPRIEQIDPLGPEQEIIRRAADIIAAGGLVIYPTRSLYGLGVDAQNPGAVKRVFEVKKRAPANPVSILISDRQVLDGFVEDISDTAERIMDRFWPGGITLVLRAKTGVPGILTAGTGTVAIRLPAHPAAAALAEATGSAITATSANLSGDPGGRRIRDITRAVKEAVDLVLDAGTLEPGTGSTILDVTCEPPKILRHGPVTEEDLRPLLQATG
ncbi:MAG: L-threonylcarbamoyladenylate synthase [Desulfosalsimonadaceae bacterium]